MTVLLTFAIGFIRALPYIAMVTAVLMLYNSFIENPRIIHDARQAYLLEVEAVAAKAELDERRRQEEVARATAKAFEARAAIARAEAEKTAAALSADVTKYKDELAKAKRTCPLTKRDIEWITGK